MNAPATNLRPTPRIAVAGCGYWGRNLVRNFHALGALAAVVDATPAGRALAAQLAPGAEVLDDIAPLLVRQDIDAIALATPAITHGPLGLRVLTAGKDLFVEKPMALNLADARALIKKSSATGRMLQVGHLLEYHPAVAILKTWVAAGRLGRLQRLHAHSLNFGKIRTEENALWSLAPHDIAVILRLQGAMPEKASCRGTHALGTPRVDFAVTVLHFAHGVEAHILSSWLNPTKEQKFVLVGERGMAVFDDTAAENKLTFYDQSVTFQNGQPELHKGATHTEQLSADEPLRLQCAAFLDAITTRRPPLADGVSGLRVLAVLDACERSMQSGGRPTAVESI